MYGAPADPSDSPDLILTINNRAIKSFKFNDFSPNSIFNQITNCRVVLYDWALSWPIKG